MAVAGMTRLGQQPLALMSWIFSMSDAGDLAGRLRGPMARLCTSGRIPLDSVLDYGSKVTSSPNHLKGDVDGGIEG
jgi:hypothetical protein